MKKTKTLVRPVLIRKVGYNTHHLLWTKKSYDTGYARALRAHPYCQVLIPAETLHKQIHHAIRTIPVPTGSDARSVFELLIWLEQLGQLDFCDSIEERLIFLINHLKTERTTDALRRQLNVVERGRL